MTASFYVLARDSTGVRGPQSPRTTVTTTSARPPTAPGTPVASGVTATSVVLSWTPATAGDFPIQRYEVFLANGSGVGTPDGATTRLTFTGLQPATAYGFYVVARDTAGVASPASPTVQVTTLTGPPATLKAQYKNNDTAPGDGQVKPGLTLVNGGSSAVALSTVTIRYYFTAEAGSASYNTWCDYAAVGAANVTTRVVALATPVNGADHYLEVGFSTAAGSVAAGATIGDVQARFNKADWSALNEANDYSYATNTSYADAPKVTVYVSGQLVWGTEPG
jgi:chitodextrinase